AEADNQVARVLLAKNNPVIAADRRKAVAAAMRAQKKEHRKEMQARDAEHQRAMQARDERERQKLRKIMLRLCGALAIDVTAERHALLDAMTGDELDALCNAISEQHHWPETL